MRLMKRRHEVQLVAATCRCKGCIRHAKILHTHTQAEMRTLASPSCARSHNTSLLATVLPPSLKIKPPDGKKNKSRCDAAKSINFQLSAAAPQLSVIPVVSRGANLFIQRVCLTSCTLCGKCQQAWAESIKSCGAIQMEKVSTPPNPPVSRFQGSFNLISESESRCPAHLSTVQGGKKKTPEILTFFSFQRMNNL